MAISPYLSNFLDWDRVKVALEKKIVLKKMKNCLLPEQD
jgi:hypothetical protein